MIPSDNNSSGHNLSEYSLKFASIRGQVITNWKSKLLDRSNFSKIGRGTTLIDSLPIIFDGLVEALTPDYPRDLASSGTNLGQSHGFERAHRSAYNSSDIIEELIIFRDSVFSIAEKNGITIDYSQANIIIKSLDLIMVESLTSFEKKYKRDINEKIIDVIANLKVPIYAISASLNSINVKNLPINLVNITKEISKNLASMIEIVDKKQNNQKLRRKANLGLRVDNLDIEQVALEVINDMDLNHSVFIYNAQKFRGFWCKSSLKIAMQNMIFNAQKHSFRNEPLTVSINKFEDRVLFSVHNEGLPIPQLIMDKIIEDLELSDESNVNNWSVGLQIIQIVAESHGGKIIFDSEKDRGTTFSMNLPIDSRQYIADILRSSNEPTQ